MDELNKEIDNFYDYLNDFEEDYKERMNSLKRINELLGNYGSVTNEETTQYQVLGD